MKKPIVIALHFLFIFFCFVALRIFYNKKIIHWKGIGFKECCIDRAIRTKRGRNKLAKAMMGGAKSMMGGINRKSKKSDKKERTTI
jgi:hypothetical protein